MQLKHRLATLAAAATVVTGIVAIPAGPAAAAGPGTITYVQADNVWVAHQDGTGARQLTSDGTAALPWRSPTQSDAGQVVAGRGNLVYRMDQWGTVLGTIDPPDVADSAGQVLGGPPAHLAVSPDGSKIAYTYEKYSCPVGLACKMRYVTAFTSSTAVTDPTVWGVTFYDAPSWVTNSRVAVTQDLIQNVRLFDLARGDTYWFDENVYSSDDRTLSDFEIARNAGYAVAVRGDGDQTQAIFYSITGNYLDGGRPPFPTPLCATTEEPGIASPTWSADGGLVAWQEPTGVWAAAMGSAPCEAQPYLMSGGASQPSYSSAALQQTRPTYPPQPFATKAKPKIGHRGPVVPGRALTASKGSFAPRPTAYRYQWLRDKKVLKGAKKATYRVRKADRGHRLQVRVTALRQGYRNAVVVSAPVRVRR
jgi:hypothetical protein